AGSGFFEGDVTGLMSSGNSPLGPIFPSRAFSKADLKSVGSVSTVWFSVVVVVSSSDDIRVVMLGFWFVFQGSPRLVWFGSWPGNFCKAQEVSIEIVVAFPPRIH